MERLARHVLCVKEVAEYLRVSTTWVYRMLERDPHSLPAYKIGGTWRFNIEDLDAWRLGKTNGLHDA
jgi:excisionase family DNA binding protein